MSAVPPFDPTCPWRAACKSRRITTSNGLLRHLVRFHNLTSSGRDEWLSRLRNPADYYALGAALRSGNSWLCTTCFKIHAQGVHSCSTNLDTCQRFGTLKMALFPLMRMFSRVFPHLSSLTPCRQAMAIQVWDPWDPPYSPWVLALAAHVLLHLATNRHLPQVAQLLR